MALCLVCEQAEAMCSYKCCSCCDTEMKEDTLFLMRRELEETLRIFQSWGPSANFRRNL